MKLSVYLSVIIAAALVASPAMAHKKKAKKSSGCITIESTASGIGEWKARIDARKAWRVDAGAQVSGAAAANMRFPVYKCNPIGTGIARHLNVVCRLKAQACPDQGWTP